ncbi:MAG: IS256 family transposase [Deltaproteobacteria bacterium]|nr:IS256 family transposase [Deltaproteobacteria bacterium]
MEKKIAPSEQKAQALRTLLQGHRDGQSGEELLSTIVRLSTERILQEALEHEQAEALGRGRYEARGAKLGYRNGYEQGTLKTAEGLFHVQRPQIRGREEPFRSALWNQMATTSDVLKRLIVEMYVGGLSQRDIEYSLESALGHFVLGKSTVSEISATLSEEYEAWRTRDLSQETVTYLFIDTVYEPLRRWGQKTGILCVWAICEDGRKVLVHLSTTNSESYESCVDVLRELVKRGMRTPITITTDGAGGLTKAIDAVWPKSLRIRCWFHKMQNFQQKVPARAWPEVKALLVDMRDAPSREKAEQRRDAIVEQYQREFPELCRCLLDDADASLNHLAVPQRHQQYVRTSNLVERTFVEERRRTKVIPHLWAEGDVVMLVYDVLIRVSERWDKKCFSELEQQQMRSLRVHLKLDEQEVSAGEISQPVHTRRSAASAA